MKISQNHTAASIQNGDARPGGRQEGFEEQWLRALEKDHLEQQISKMRCTPFRGVHGDPDGTQGPLTEASNPMCPMPGARGGRTPVSDAIKPTADAAGGNAPHTGVMAGSGHGARQDPRTVEFGHTVFQRRMPHAGPRRVAGQNEARWLQVRRLLPPSSSLSIFVDGDGVHVVIRDASLLPDETRRLLDKIRALFGVLGERLEAVTLNGHFLWKRRSDVTQGEFEDGTQYLPRMNKLF